MINEEPVPEQTQGGQTDTAATVTLPSEEEAEVFFRQACARLKDVNNWEQVCGSGATGFALIDEHGEPALREAAQGDFLRIDIPGPGNSSGKGYDWVRVEDMGAEREQETELFFIRVRPAEPPVSSSHDIAHFFKPDATSTFMIKRTGNTISAEVHGRNEKPNTSAGNLPDKIRNAMVGTASLLGFSLPQWKMLVKGLVKTDDETGSIK